MTSALVRSSGWPVSKVCSARADAATSSFFRALQCSASCCLRVWPVCSMYTLGNPLQGMEYTTPLLVQWYWVFGVYQHVVEGAQWTKDHLDAQLCENSSHCLRETIDVGKGYVCSTSLVSIHKMKSYNHR